MKHVYHLKTLTPIFSYGADPHKAADRRNNIPVHEGTPEIRAASIRGQLRWWMEFIGHRDQIAPIFGSTAGSEGRSSLLKIRVSNIEGRIGEKRCTEQHNWSTKTCFLPGTSFDLEVLETRQGLSEDQRNSLKNTLNAWLNMGTLGGRGTRAAGSITFSDSSQTEEAWMTSCATLLSKAEGRLFLGRTGYQSESEARRLVCDTLKEDAFNGQQPLGGIRPRKTSPLRMRVVRFSDGNPSRPYRIAALWTQSNEEPLQGAIEILKRGNGRNGDPKQIGFELENAIRVK
ncbi:MAG: type III-B CRISPR module RAMP protein Cmr1 [Puniceicoccaceae bacterium]|nr:type III-B CRISPR module RAMP protein Cmr1 [Puniceicoccaceae bacterium]